MTIRFRQAPAIIRERFTHAARLERWLGAAQVEAISQAMHGPKWYGPPIAVAGVPGNVWAMPDGNFRGRIGAGQMSSAVDFAVSRMKRIWRHAAKRHFVTAYTGLASLDDLIAEATTGKRREWQFLKIGTTGVVGASSTLWQVGNMPAAGSAGSAAPGGRACSSATTGAFPIADDPSGSDTRHFVAGFPLATVGLNTLLLYDRIFDVAKTMSSSGAESVTGVPTRYQSSTATDPDYAGGNFIFVEVSSALSNTGHNWTVVQYRNQAGTDAQSAPSMAGNNSAIVNRLDHPVGYWFMPLNTGDTGAMDLSQIQCSSATLTGGINFCLGHPIAWMPCPFSNLVCVADGINTAFNLTRIFAAACMAFLEVGKSATTATIYTGTFTTVDG